MPQAPRTPPRPIPPRAAPARPVLGSLVVIAVVVGGAAAAFAYTAGWLSPQRLTPDRMVDAFRPPSGEALGHRRNHAKGVCFTGTFEANGQGTALSRAKLLAQGSYPVLGRFNLGTANPGAPDGTVDVRGLSIQVTGSDGQPWRSGMITLPFFPVSTVPAFYELLQASGSKDPGAMPAFAAAHPEIKTFGAAMAQATRTGSYAEERYNSINAFLFVDGQGTERAVRWSMLPAAQPSVVSAEDLARRPPDFLEQDLRDRIAQGPLRWTLSVTVADAADPVADPNKPWPDGRRTVPVGTLVVQAIQLEPDGPCRDINFDPTVLPDGMKTSADPFPAARSSAYAVSYDRRTAEAKDYPRTQPASQPEAKP